MISLFLYDFKLVDAIETHVMEQEHPEQYYVLLDFCCGSYKKKITFV